MPDTTIQANDLVPVRSRVSWGAILAGAVVALAAWLLLSTLGTAIGFSLTDAATTEQVGTGFAVWAILSLLVSLFLGGWVASQCTTGENRLEAVFYGIVVWGVVFAVLLWLVAGSVMLGFNAIMGLANMSVGTAATYQLNDDQLVQAGFTAQEIAENRAEFDKLGQTLTQRFRDTVANNAVATEAAWWTFGGILLSMLASIGGALLGAGPTFILAGLSQRTTVMYGAREQQPAGR